ncbi:MAG: hypothetical protein MZV63_32875 [Marinilabiliales bacterium]|nr:hypothetical protein [Marinilabiliales bacterium]
MWAYVESLYQCVGKLPVSYGSTEYGRQQKELQLHLGKLTCIVRNNNYGLTSLALLQSAPYDYNLALLTMVFFKDLKTKETVFAVVHGVWQGSKAGHSTFSDGAWRRLAGGKLPIQCNGIRVQ